MNFILNSLSRVKNNNSTLRYEKRQVNEGGASPWANRS